MFGFSWFLGNYFQQRTEPQVVQVQDGVWESDVCSAQQRGSLMVFNGVVCSGSVLQYSYTQADQSRSDDELILRRRRNKTQEVVEPNRAHYKLMFKLPVGDAQVKCVSRLILSSSMTLLFKPDVMKSW